MEQFGQAMCAVSKDFTTLRWNFHQHVGEMVCDGGNFLLSVFSRNFRGRNAETGPLKTDRRVEVDAKTVVDV